ncbi:MAG: dethiobiotin synthase [Phycisphaeraceae bacterium]|nr:dethiobiotin synthase [Phycisphaeraceae bacterium]
MTLGTYSPTRPGLFVTGTDTGVGKTVVSCAICRALRDRQPRIRIGALKPMASGCRRDREGLVSEDAEALAHFADSRQPLDVVNPIRFAAPLSPAAAAEKLGRPIDYEALDRSLKMLDEQSDVVLIEGVGGVMVPIDPDEPQRTVLDLMVAWDYPVLVVCRAGLGTLNHTALTVRALREAKLRVAGLVINGMPADTALSNDPSMAGNRQWLEKLTGVRVLTALPPCEAESVHPHQARIHDDILELAAMVDWLEHFKAPRTADRASIAEGSIR